MPRLSAPRAGESIRISKKAVSFSYFPAEKPARFYKLKPILFTTNPWGLIEQSIKTTCPNPQRKAALGFLRQAEDNYFAATSAGVMAAKPVLLYYSNLNLVKSLLLTRGAQTNLDSAIHGLSDRRTPPSSPSLTAAHLDVEMRGNRVSIFSEFLKLFTGAGATVGTSYRLSVLMPQAVPGHRMWASAIDRGERILAIEAIEFFHDPGSMTAWMNLSILSEDLSRLGKTHQAMLRESQLATDWEEVAGRARDDAKSLLTFQMKNPIPYTGQPAEKLEELVSALRNQLRSTVLSVPPYRRYYLYMAPVAEHPFVLPELVSIYALSFYFGSITRYRPHHFNDILDGPYGRFVQSCLSDHPTQFLFLMAGEFAKQEITKPAIV